MEKCDLYCDGIYSYTIPAGSDVDAVIFFTNQYDQTNDISLSTVCANDMLTVSDPSAPIVIASSVWGVNKRITAYRCDHGIFRKKNHKTVKKR